MKLLVDGCLSRRTVAALRAAGHDVVHTKERGPDPGDAAIIALANSERRVLVTLDEDFGELAFHQRMPHAGIIRIIGALDIDHPAILFETFERYEGDLATSAFVVVEPGRRTRVTWRQDA